MPEAPRTSCAVLLLVVAAIVAAHATSPAPAAAIEKLPEKLVVLTFDDSVKSHATVVGPLLKKHGFGATFFITEGFDVPSNKRDYMSWTEIKTLHDDGFEIGNHTRDHFVVNANNVDRLREQIEAITVRCREHGIPDPVSFAYPGNGFDVKALPILRECGIRWARRGGAPEYTYLEGRGSGYEPERDHPLLIPSTIDARPSSTAGQIRREIDRVLSQGHIPVIQFHGTPDTAHQWVNFPQKEFEELVHIFANGGYKPIALRGLAEYVDPDRAPADPMAIIEERRERRRIGTTIVHPVDGAEMVYVPAGKFVMGLSPKEGDEIARLLGYNGSRDIQAEDSFPGREFLLDGFFIDRYETTVGQWKRFVSATGHKPARPEATEPAGDTDRSRWPIANVGWDEAKAYAKWAGRSLSTEAQWEKAARGNEGYYFPWGNDRPTPRHRQFGADVRQKTGVEPVGRYDRGMSPYGAFDMLGNVAEWTADWIEPYPGNRNPDAMRDRSGKTHVAVRGGSWKDANLGTFAARRDAVKPDEVAPTIGFRTVWIPPKGYFDSAEFRRDQNAFEQVATPLTENERSRFELKELRQKLALSPDYANPHVSDAAIFLKGIDWALRYDLEFSRADRKLLDKAVGRCRQRLDEIYAGRTPWMSVKGKQVLGYTSEVDGSVRPYGVIVPAKYDPKMPIRLDVVLHGSTKPVGLSELRFMARFDEGDVGDSFVPEVSYIELHPLGRVENCYRWAGETDVFEAIADVCKRYNIDKSRIVLRGMSMGASGTWHLGLKHPEFFAALGPYCGYVDTHRFSETPLPNFVKVGPLPPHQELGLHMLDSVDYAANASVVPVVAAMGEKDIFFDAHVIMGAAFEKEGLKLVNLISPGTGHVVDPVTHAEQLKRIEEHLGTTRGRPAQFFEKPLGDNSKRVQRTGPAPPDELRFVTWTLKYSRCHWVQLLGLENHYARAEFRARVKDRAVEVKTQANVTRFAIFPESLGQSVDTVRIAGVEYKVQRPDSEHANGPPIAFIRDSDRWKQVRQDEAMLSAGKRPGLQGPIDDAFTMPFLCVRGTGTPWNAAAHAFADAALDRFAEEWRHYFRGECPIKNDADVTEEDVRTKNLILFGDPGSNPWIAKVLPSLPLQWTKDKLTMGGAEYPAADHLPALIQPNPLREGEGRYVVLNSGHTFRESELSRVNYLLFPRWGDWAVLKIAPPGEGANPPSEEVLKAGYYGEDWR